MRKLVRKGVEDLVPYPPGKPIEELERELGISGSINWLPMKTRWGHLLWPSRR